MMPNIRKTNTRNISTLTSPFILCINAFICLRKLGIVFIALRGLRMRRVRTARIFTAEVLVWSVITSAREERTMMKSRVFQESRK